MHDWFSDPTVAIPTVHNNSDTTFFEHHISEPVALGDEVQSFNSSQLSQKKLFQQLLKHLQKLECQVSEEDLLGLQEQVLRQLALVAQRKHYQELFDQAPDGYLVTDITGRIYEANQTIAHWLQLKSSQLLGKALQALIASTHLSQFQHQWNTLLKTTAQDSGSIYLFLLSLQSATQTEIPVELSVKPVRNPQQEIVGFRWMVRLLSSQRQAEVDILQLNAQLQKQVVAQAAALQRAKRQLEAQVYTDHLTKVANRRQFDQHLHQEWRRCQRQSLPLTLVMCDVDYFKRYNDLNGHLAGDACLRRVAQVLKRTIGRSGDLVARYGGEEFALILPATITENALQLIAKLRSRIAKLAIINGDSPLSMSFGLVTVIPNRQETPDKLVAAADQALYLAKRNGRDQYHLGSVVTVS